MPVASSYAELLDEETSSFDFRKVLRTGGDTEHTFTCNIPSGFIDSHAALFTFQHTANEPINTFKWHVLLNGNVIVEETYTLPVFCVRQEVFSGNLLHIGKNNVKFKLISGTGILRINNMAMHFKVNA